MEQAKRGMPALLSPQGKILFDFFVVQHRDGYLLDVVRSKAGDLVKRLTMYKLRADVAIADDSVSFDVYAAWDDGAAGSSKRRGMSFRDPRHPSLGLRLMADVHAPNGLSPKPRIMTTTRFACGSACPKAARTTNSATLIRTKPISICLTVCPSRRAATSDRKSSRGCRTRRSSASASVKISADRPLTSNADVLVGDVPIGRVGTVDGNGAIAMLRLDRVLERSRKTRN